MSKEFGIGALARGTPARVALLLAALAPGCSSVVTAALPGCWSGRLGSEGLVWDVGLQITSEGGELAAAIDMDALWRAREPLPSFHSDGRAVRFDLPWSMGRFAGRSVENRLEGEVTFKDKRRSPLELERAPCAEHLREEINWRTDDVSIAATLTLPAGPGPFPAVVVLHGGGDSSRESPPYRFWSEYLPRLGIACLVYDKRGNGESTGDWRQVAFEPRARDVAGGLAQLRARSDIDATRLGLLAISQGSWVAGLAARLDPGVSFVVHVSGPAVSVAEADTYALESELRRQGWPEEDIAERVGLWRLNVEVARDPASDEAWGRLQTAIDEARSRDWFAEDPYHPERYSQWRSWYQRVLAHDPRPVLETLDVPMLWAYGAMDGQSDPAKNVAILEASRRRGKDYTIAVYPEAGHGLLIPVDSQGRDGELLTTAPGFFPDLTRWLERQVSGARRAVAFTFDDLPGTALAGGNCDAGALMTLNRRLLEHLERFAIPATGLVTESRVCDQLREDVLPQVLSLWLDAGHGLGNHTFSHLDLNTTPLDLYIRDIVEGERTVRHLLGAQGRELRFFRHPLLHTGADISTKEAVSRFLEARGYQVAPVTIDNQEWVFSAVYAQAKAAGDRDAMARVATAYVPFMEEVFAFFEDWSRTVLGREIPQVLLLHANELNADHLPRLAEMVRRRGYDFVSLEEALEDEAYGSEDGYVGPRGLSWLHRWAVARGLEPRQEPREPEWVAELLRSYRRN